MSKPGHRRQSLEEDMITWGHRGRAYHLGIWCGQFWSRRCRAYRLVGFAWMLIWCGDDLSFTGCTWAWIRPGARPAGFHGMVPGHCARGGSYYLYLLTDADAANMTIWIAAVLASNFLSGRSFDQAGGSGENSSRCCLSRSPSTPGWCAQLGPGQHNLVHVPGWRSGRNPLSLLGPRSLA